MTYRKPLASLLFASILLSAAILSCSSVSNLPNPFASPTPTATATFTPTATPSPTPTPTSTPTPLPTGMAIHDAPGGGSRFFDYDGGYTIDVSPDWAPVLVEREQMDAAISQFADTNPGIANALKNSPGAVTKAFRMIAYDKAPDHYSNGYVANFSVAMFQDRAVTSMPLDLLVQATVDQVKRQFPGAKIKKLPTKVNGQALAIGSSEGEATFNMPNAGKIVVYEKQYYFQTKTAFVLVSLYVPKGVSTLVTPSFDKVVNGIRLLQH